MSRNQSYLIFLLLFNTAVAVILTLLGKDRSFPLELLFSHCIGLSCGLPALVVVSHARSTRQLRVGLTVCIFFGVIVGVALARMLSAEMAASHTISAGQALIVGLVFALGAGYFFLTSEGTRRLERELRAQQARRAELDRAHAAMQLRLLQSQVEPHFLFNTLAHLSALIRSDPAQAEKLLLHLNGFLRATLRRNRQESATLEDELTLLRDYLSIVGVRLGARLRWSFEIDPGLEKLNFPFMLLQPLVENAIRHGLEPKVEGGTLRVQAHREADRLVVDVVDDGLGFGAHPDSAGTGMGLAHTRERLAVLYDGRASLVVADAEPGTRVTLTMPYTPDA